MGETGRSGGKGNFGQDIMYERSTIFLKKKNFHSSTQQQFSSITSLFPFLFMRKDLILERAKYNP